MSPAGGSRPLLARALAPGLLLAAAAYLAIVPPANGEVADGVIFTVLIYAALGQAWNLIGGLGGQLSLGHSVFVGVGGYMPAMLLTKSGVPLAVIVPASGAAAALAALVSAPLLFRLRGVYFAVGTLALALAAQAWMVNWEYTGATQGVNIPFDALPSADLLYYLALGLVALSTATTWLVQRSRFGLRLMAVRDAEEAAAGLGVATNRTKIAAYVLSAFLVGMTGALIALNQIIVIPENLFGLDWTIQMIVVTIVGGSGTVAGPLVGAFVIYYLIDQPLEGHASFSVIVTGLLLIAMVRFAPGGLWGLFERLRRWIAGKPTRPLATVDEPSPQPTSVS